MCVTRRRGNEKNCLTRKVDKAHRHPPLWEIAVNATLIRLTNEQDASIRDSRGLARALTGNFKGAIADFQFFVQHTDSEERKKQRQSWIKALKKGKNPFTEEVLQSLKGQ